MSPTKNRNHDWAAFWLKRGKKKPLGNFLNYLVGYNVRKESRASLCKLGSWNIRLQQDTSAFVFREAESRGCRLAECCLSLCPAASQSSHYSLDRGQNIHNYQWEICYYQSLLWPPNKFSTGIESPSFPIHSHSSVPTTCTEISWRFLLVQNC